MNYAELSDDESTPVPMEITEMLDTINNEFNIEQTPDDTEPLEEYNFEKFKEDYRKVSGDLIDIHKKYHTKLKKFREIETAILSISSEKYIENFLEIIDDFKKNEDLTGTKQQLEKSTKKFHQMRKTAILMGDCDMGNKYTCFLCLKNGIDTVYDPCCHVVCGECHGHMMYRECAFCRTPITSVKKLYISN